MSRPRKRSLIPEKAQVPIAIGGAILLALIVIYQVYGRRQDNAEAEAARASAALVPPEEVVLTPTEPAAGTAVGADLAAALPAAGGEAETLRVLASQLRQYVVQAGAKETVAPSVGANPFSPFGAGVPPDPPIPADGGQFSASGFSWGPGKEEVLETLSPDEQGPSEEELERNERLENLRLSATARTSQWSMAVINGVHYREGDQVEGFTLSHIGEKEVTLRDAFGTETLSLAANGLVSPAPRTAHGEEDILSAPAEALSEPEVDLLTAGDDAL